MQKGQKGSCFQVQLWARVSTAKAMRTVTSPVLAPGSGKAQHIVELMVVINLPSKCLLCNVARAKRKCRALAGFINSEILAQSCWPSAALLSRAGGREQGAAPSGLPTAPQRCPRAAALGAGAAARFPLPGKGRRHSRQEHTRAESGEEQCPGFLPRGTRPRLRSKVPKNHDQAC